jgi:hypothetical protein
MWKRIDKDTYMKKVKGLKPIEGFSDPDGTLHFGYGKPAMDTIWGIVGKNDEPDQPIVKCEMRKENHRQLDWDIEYFEYV